MNKLILAAIASLVLAASGSAFAQPATHDLMSQYYIGR